MIRAAIVGLGRWGQNLVESVQGKSDAIRFTAGATRTPEKSRAFADAHGFPLHHRYEKVLTDPAIDLVYVASNHASHADYAMAALEAGKSVHIEKPHVVDDDQLIRLCEAIQGSRGNVALGFNRPDSPLGREVLQRLGEQPGAAMLNWFVCGHEIPSDHWYNDEREGGRVLGNLCHWIDFVYRSIAPEDRYPILIRPTRAAQSDDVAVTYTFADGSIAAITFSAKGHAFEGVRERLSAQRGDLLLSLTDFKELTTEVVERRERRVLRFRDHGHENAILRSYRMSDRAEEESPGSPLHYVWETAELFLRTRDALERDEILSVAPFSADRLVTQVPTSPVG